MCLCEFATHKSGQLLGWKALWSAACLVPLHFYQPSLCSPVEIIHMKKTMHISKFLKLAGIALLVHAASASAASMYTPETGSYLNGGIGVDGRHSMQAQRKHYNLHLRFAQAKTGEYLSGVSVAIAPVAKKGETLHFEDAGPWLYVRLHPGSYRISAVYEGHKQVRTVAVGKAATDTVMYWR